MEKELKIKTKDNHLIYGTLNSPKNKSKSLIIFVHGLTGHQNEHIFYNGAKFFTEKGFNTFRFDLYSGEKKARALSETTIKIHASDLDTVVKYFRKKFKKIFVIGHSLGAPTIFLSDTNSIDGIVFWDPAAEASTYLNDPKDREHFKYIKCLNAYAVNWGTEFIIHKKMFNDLNNILHPKEAMKRIHKPIKIIVAGNNILLKAGKEYFKYANKPKYFSIIKNADHNFNPEGTESELFRETLNFLKKI